MTVTEVDKGRRKVAFTTEVATPAGELFALVSDPHRHGELDGSGTVKDTVKGPDRMKHGDKFSVKMKQYGVPYRITSTVTDYSDGHVLEWRHPMGHKWRWEFEPTATGTKVTETFDYSEVPGATAKFFELTGVPRKNSAGIRRTLEKLSTVRSR